MKRENYSVLLNEKFRREFLNKAILKFDTQTSLAKYLNSKIKRRKIIRENIKEWLKGKHNLGWNIMIPIDVVEELCKINSQNLEEVFYNVIKFNPPWKNPKKKDFLIPKNNKLIIKEIFGKTYLDLSSILPETTLKSVRSEKKLPLFAKISNEEIELWSEANWKRSSIKLKRFIELNNLFFVGSSIYLSEGNTKIGKYNISISIGNSEPSIMNLFFKWINSFFKDYRMNIRIEFNGNRFNKEKLINFWKKDVPYIRESKISVKGRPQFGSRLINNMGTLNVKISNTVLKSFLINLLKASKKIVLFNKMYSLDYLRGLLACEGSVSSYPSLKQISIGSSNSKEKKFIKNLLKKLRLKFTEGKNQFSITGWDSFLFLYKSNVFNIPQINSISKKKVFNKGFKEHQVTKGLIKLEKFNDRKFRATDWQEKFNLKYYISAHNFLRKFVESNLLLTQFNKNVKFYYINPKKTEFLRRIWGIKDL